MTRMLRLLPAFVAVVMSTSAGAPAQTVDEIFARGAKLVEASTSEERFGTERRVGLEQGIQLLRQALDAGFADRVTAYRLLARAFLSLGALEPWDSAEHRALTDQARGYYEQAIALDPKDLETRLDFATLILTDRQAVRSALDEILEMNPRHAPTLRVLGQLLIDEGDLEGGLTKMRDSVEFATDGIDVEMNGRALISQLERFRRTTEAETVRQLVERKLNEPQSLEIVAGDAQQARVGATVNRLAVRVWSLGRRHVPGQPVTFAIVMGSGTLSQTTVLTDERGVAGTVLTLGDTPGAIKVEARWRDQTLAFNITAVR